MRTIVALMILLSGCVHLPERCPQGIAVHDMHIAGILTGRSTEGIKPPPVYIARTRSEFFHMTCRDRNILCGFSAIAVYIPVERVIIVNNEEVDNLGIDGILVHEMTHYLQSFDKKRRPCIDIEVEAYSAQYAYTHSRSLGSIYQDAFNSCNNG